MAKTIPFLVRLSPELRRALKRLAKRLHDTEARQVREALREYLKKHAADE